MHVKPFPITAGDVANDPPAKPKEVSVKRRKPRFQALSEDAIWIIEEDLSRTKAVLQQRVGPLTDKEHSRIIKSIEQLRKMRMTDAEMNKIDNPDDLDDAELGAEFEERCEVHGLDPDAVRKVFGL